MKKIFRQYIEFIAITLDEKGYTQTVLLNTFSLVGGLCYVINDLIRSQMMAEFLMTKCQLIKQISILILPPALVHPESLNDYFLIIRKALFSLCKTILVNC